MKIKSEKTILIYSRKTKQKLHNSSLYKLIRVSRMLYIFVYHPLKIIYSCNLEKEKRNIIRRGLFVYMENG